MNNQARRYFMGGKKESFIMNVSMAANETFTLPLNNTGNYNFIVNWGDGNTDIITTYNQTEINHAYSSAGNYDIVINGIIEQFGFQGAGSSRLNVIEIKGWGPLLIDQREGAFWGCTNLVSITASDTPRLGSDIRSLFRGCSSLTSINLIEDWDTSNVIDMSVIFFEATLFNENISNWDISNVTTLSNALQRTSFNQNISNWNISNVTSMTNMLQGSTLSTSNYDALLIGWESQAVQNNVSFHGGNSTYTLGGAAEAARTSLENPATNNWTITDGGGIAA